ncbi:unnamed protein product [Linum tenue]|uniref:RNase H type-1 domain-containing protein n=1 Tax=Linum tenue TaxID=586396 RepID=A0AAV0P1K2_9ROSI|nr:unnamed protein product [Linum tenue]
MLQAFSVNLGGGSITHAELAGIEQGMRLAWEMGIRKLAVQTDSATAISLIQEDPSSHPHRMLVKSIRRSLSLEWEVTIDHVFREGNFVADFLASRGHALPVGLHVVDVPGPILGYWLYYDTIGVQTPRSIIN